MKFRKGGSGRIRFAMQRGLRIISVARSYDCYRCFIRRMILKGLSSVSRFYEITLEDSEGSRGDLYVAFDPLWFWATGRAGVRRIVACTAGQISSFDAI